MRHTVKRQGCRDQSKMLAALAIQFADVTLLNCSRIYDYGTGIARRETSTWTVKGFLKRHLSVTNVNGNWVACISTIVPYLSRRVTANSFPHEFQSSETASSSVPTRRPLMQPLRASSQLTLNSNCSSMVN